jgi:hypothetical protein
LFEAEAFNDATGGNFSVLQQFHDGNAGGMSQGLKDAGFEFS